MPLANLLSITDKVTVQASLAADLDIVANWSEYDKSVATASDRGDTKSNVIAGYAATTLQDAVPVPESANIRSVVTDMTCFNKHASVSPVVTVRQVKLGTPAIRHQCTLAPGEMLSYEQGNGFYVYKLPSLPLLMKVLDADAAGQNVITAQPWFPTLGAVAVAANTCWRLYGWLHLATGVTTHTTGILFGGTASLVVSAPIDHNADIYSPVTVDSIVAASSYKHSSSAANAVLNATSTAGSTAIFVEGVLRVNAAGTIIPQFQFNAAPGSCTVKRGSFFRLELLGPNTITSIGTWT
jgi:hypothetical protein